MIEDEDGANQLAPDVAQSDPLREWQKHLVQRDGLNFNGASHMS